MKRFVATAIWFCAGMGLSLVLLELGLRALPVFGGVYAADPNEDWPIHHLIANTGYTYSAGWNLANVHRGRINNYGYVAPFDYVERSRGIVVLGDSYIESLMTPYGDTLQGSLESYLTTPEPVLNFGVSGASLPHYVGVGPLVREHFEPTWMIVLITSRDFIEGFEQQPGFYFWQPDKEVPVQLRPRRLLGEFARAARGLALVRYGRANLKLSLDRLVQFKTDAAQAPCRVESLSAADKALLEKFLKALPAESGLPASRIILVFDADRHAIYSGQSGAIGAGCVSLDEAARLMLEQRAPGIGMHVVATAPLFEKFYKSTGRQLDYLPQDGHWNANAHRLVAQSVAAIINAAGHEDSIARAIDRDPATAGEAVGFNRAAPKSR